jgi:multicomponent Na+:H+ antiporter subunit C
MNTATLFAICAAALIGIGLYGLIVQPHPLRKLLSINVIGSGVFVLFGAIAERATLPHLGTDPVPQALVITGIVVAFSATALAVALLLRLAEASGSASLSADPPAGAEDDGREG